MIRSSPGSQVLYQFIALIVTLAISIIGGLLIGLVVRSAKRPGSPEFKVENMYDDESKFTIEVSSDLTLYFLQVLVLLIVQLHEFPDQI